MIHLELILEDNAVRVTDTESKWTDYLTPHNPNNFIALNLDSDMIIVWESEKMYLNWSVDMIISNSSMLGAFPKNRTYITSERMTY